jgi:hypothetical protein
MTTSGVTAWSLTGNDVVKAALNELGVLSLGTDPDAEESDACLLRLNAMLKSWALRGVSLFREETGTIAIPGGSASGTLDAGIRNISSARLVVSATQHRPLFPMTRTAYLNMPNKATVGNPTSYYLSRGAAANELFVWPVSATDITLAIDYDRVPETITAGTETLDIREELQETVYANLAIRCAGVFGAQISPELAARAQMLETLMLDAERPDFYSFESEYDYG